MLDGSRKLRDEWLLPAGLLREPIAACRRADLLIVSRRFERPDIEARDAHRFSIFYAHTRLLGFRRFRHKHSTVYLSEIGPGPFVAFCGIGNPEAFFSDLGHWHVPVIQTKAFPDHHKYLRGDIESLERAARESRAAGLITTEKDEQNLAHIHCALPIWIAVVDFVFTAESELEAAIDRALQTSKGEAA